MSSVPVLLAALALGSAALALWIDIRFPRLSPESFRAAVTHVVAALLVAQLAMVPAGALLNPANPGRAFGGVFLVVLPALIYTFLAGLWMFRICQRMLGGALR